MCGATLADGGVSDKFHLAVDFLCGASPSCCSLRRRVAHTRTPGQGTRPAENRRVGRVPSRGVLLYAPVHPPTTQRCTVTSPNCAHQLKFEFRGTRGKLGGQQPQSRFGIGMGHVKNYSLQELARSATFKP